MKLKNDLVFNKIFSSSTEVYDLSSPFLPVEFLLNHIQIEQLSLNRFLPFLNERGAPEGDATLRSEIAADVSLRFDEACKPEWVVTTNGSQQAIDLFMRCFTPGTVVTEEPGYAYTHICAQQAGHHIVSLPYDDKLQIDWAVWQQRLQFATVDALVYLMPRHSNPLGRSFSEQELNNLAMLLKNHRGLVVHDGWMDELNFLKQKKFSKIAPNVVRLGSMTKKLFPGARVGYAVIADDVLRSRFVSLKRTSSGSVSLLSEKIVCEVMQTKMWTTHLEGLSQRLKQKFQNFSQVVSPLAHIRPIEGGILCWVQPHQAVDVETINKRLLPYAKSIRVPSTWLVSNKLNGLPPCGFSVCYPRVDDETLLLFANEVLTT